MKKIIALALCTVMIVTILAGCSCTQNKNAVADGLTKINVEGKTDLPGNFFLSFVLSRNLIMLDGKGNIVWSKHEDQPYEGANTGFWDFKKHVVDGKTYYSYHDQNATTDNECMSVFDRMTREKLMSVTLENPQDITYRCVYYE